MSKRGKMILAVVGLAFVLSLSGCDWFTNTFAPPTLPSGSYPKEFGKFKLITSPEALSGFREDGYTRYQFDYKDSIQIGSIEYKLRIYRSPELANAELEANSRKPHSANVTTNWEERLNTSGQNAGKMFVVKAYSERIEGRISWCRLEYTKDGYWINIDVSNTDSPCDDAKNFAKALPY